MRILEYMFVSFDFLFGCNRRRLDWYMRDMMQPAREFVLSRIPTAIPLEASRRPINFTALPARTCWLSRVRPSAELESNTKQESRSLEARCLSFVFLSFFIVYGLLACVFACRIHYDSMAWHCFAFVSSVRCNVISVS